MDIFMRSITSESLAALRYLSKVSINEKISLYTSIILLQMWRCVRYHNLRCGHRVLTPTEDDPVGHHEGEPHNHAPDAVKVEAKKLLQNVRVEALKTQESSQSVAATVFENLLHFFIIADFHFLRLY